MPTVKLIDQALARRLHDFVRAGINLQEGRLTAKPNPFWAGLRAAGTECWLDTGDIAAASKLWCSEFTALTTNNTLLNNEVQKGIYDSLIKEAAPLLDGLDAHTKVVEIAFILNARHGLRLAQTFGGKVSVELHTDLAHDIDATVAYGKRYYAICPEHFIVKVPLTPSGLIATRKLRELGIPINFTLGFSARHNYLAAAFAKPSWVNVFLGRLNAYVADNALGDGKLVGEKATLASQAACTELSRGRAEPTRQIAASMREGAQVAALAGVDVFTIPTKCADDALAKLDGKFTNHTQDKLQVSLNPGVEAAAIRLGTLWDISPELRNLCQSLAAQPPQTGAELVERAHGAGCGDLFPRLSAADEAKLTSEGKIPKHATWAERIRQGELAIDTLLNLAGLISFTGDQTALDDRIRRLIA
jgi:transaldolase